MRKSRLLILADDATGALDSGVQFAKKGILTQVYLSLKAAEPAAEVSEAAVKVINTNTRHAPPKEAARIVSAAAKAAGDYAFFYKKTDSCLRGNIGAELEALAKSAKTKALPFVPAYPAMKRITCSGVQYVEGKPLHESSMAHDPFNPVTESFIPGIIKKQSALESRIVLLGSDIPESKNGGILIFDGTTQADLKTIALGLWKKNLLKTSAGCAGFAEALMDVLPLEKSPSVPAAVEKLPLLVISGSLHPVSKKQIALALERKVSAFCLDSEDSIKHRRRELEEALADSCSQALRETGLCVLGTRAAFGAETGPANDSSRETAKSAPLVLGEIARNIILKTGPLHLAVFGGDSLLGIMESLNYNCLIPLAEIRRGVVLAKPQGPREPGLLVTKSGAFGDEDIIFKIANYLKRKSHVRI